MYRRSSLPESRHYGYLRSTVDPRDSLDENVAALGRIESECKRARLLLAFAPARSHRRQFLLQGMEELLYLHRRLLGLYQEFFLLAGQRLAKSGGDQHAAAGGMAARMWHCGIYDFLVLLYHNLPTSRPSMHAFLNGASEIVRSLITSFPALNLTWFELLGDLSRFRMAVSSQNPSCVFWAGTARYYYLKAAASQPSCGRLQHHLAIVSRSCILQQLYHHALSVTATEPFLLSRQGLASWFKSYISCDHAPTSNSSFALAKLKFITTHAQLFSYDRIILAQRSIDEFLALFSYSLSEVDNDFERACMMIAIVNATALFDYGSATGLLKQKYDEQATGRINHSGSCQNALGRKMTFISFLVFGTFEVVLGKEENMDTLPFVHVSLVLLRWMASVSNVLDIFAHYIPWKALAKYLNNIQRPEITGALFPNKQFSEVEEKPRLLPEDRMIAGQVWTASYFCENSFVNLPSIEHSSYCASLHNARIRRVVLLAISVASVSLGHGMIHFRLH